MVAAQGLSTQLQVRAGLNRPGDVITFYSYKGGTGRSMGLVNCAGLIAQQLPADAKPILLIDFDLEAPGLHRYLQPFMTNEDMESRQGVLELFEALAAEVTRCLAEEPLETDSASNEPDSTEDSRRLDDEKTQTLVDAFDLAPFIVSTQIKGLHLIVSGRFDSTYDQRLTRFDWEALYAKAPALFRCLGARFAREYSYTFVDSRTGLSDTSGICTMLLPSVLVVVFTPNSQSLTGIEHLVRRAMSYRESGADSRELRIYPLPSRVDNQVEHFRQVWRMGDPHHSLFGTVTGYQPLFERVFETMIASGGLDASAQLGEYFDAVQIPHTADYAYGERLCFVSAASADNLSIRNSFEQFLPWIATGAQPWERPAEVTLNQQATHWLRDSGADHEPAEESGWHAWYERLAQVLRTPEHPVIHQYASLAPDTRVDTSIVLALAYAYQGDGAAATEWIRRAVNAYDDNVAVSLCTTAPLQLLRLWTDALAADEFTPELEAWVPEVDAWMLRWQPLKTERRMWLLELVELARKRRLYEFLWRAQAELEGGASDAALQSMAIFVDVLCDRGDFERARHLQMQLVETCSQAFGDDDPATIEARLKLDAIGVKRVSVGGATPRALRDCRYSAYISYAVYDDMAWNHWVTGFASVLDKTLWSRFTASRLYAHRFKGM